MENLTFNEIKSVELPKGKFDDSTVQSINGFFTQNGFPNPSSFGDDFENDYGGYIWLKTFKPNCGTFPKRIAKLYFNRLNLKLSNDFLGKLGQIASGNCALKEKYHYDFTKDFNWDKYDFGQYGGSCFWGERSGALDVLKENGAFAIRFFIEPKTFNHPIGNFIHFNEDYERDSSNLENWISLMANQFANDEFFGLKELNKEDAIQFIRNHHLDYLRAKNSFYIINETENRFWIAKNNYGFCGDELAKYIMINGNTYRHNQSTREIKPIFSLDKKVISTKTDNCAIKPLYYLDDKNLFDSFKPNYGNGKLIDFGRAWIVPISPNGNKFIMFNGYGFDLVEQVRVFSYLTGLPYKKISLCNMGCASDLIYINGGTGYIVGEHDSINDISRYDLKFDIDDKNYQCSSCSHYFVEDDIRFVDEDCYCHDCFSELFYICDNCGEIINQDDAISPHDANDYIYCERCASNHLYICDDCGYHFRDCLNEINGLFYCEDCTDEHLDELKDDESENDETGENENE